MAEYIATEDATFSFLVSTAGTVTIVPATSYIGKFKADGKTTYGLMHILVTNATNGIVTAATGTAFIPGGATKVSTVVSSLIWPVVLEGDSETITLTGVIGLIPASYQDTITIATAGQTVAKAV